MLAEAVAGIRGVAKGKGNRLNKAGDHSVVEGAGGGGGPGKGVVENGRRQRRESKAIKGFEIG